MLRSLVSKRSAPLLLAVLPLVGCPDPDAAYDDYVDRRPAPPVVPDMGERDALVGGLPDVTGVHLLAIATFIDPDRPLLFKADVTLTPNPSPTPDNAGTLSVTAQGLRCQYQMECDRIPVGDSLPTITGPVKENGDFRLDFGQQTVVGEANPISGRPITAVLVLDGSLKGDALACGLLGGQVFDPIMAPLDGTGSSFALTKLGETGASVDFLSALVVKECPEPGEPDAGVPSSDAALPLGGTPGPVGGEQPPAGGEVPPAADAGPQAPVDAGPPVPVDARPPFPSADAAPGR
jgi:hypothetical protein